MNKFSTKSIATPNEPALASASQRYLSLDVLRGMTVALMIVVNTPGSWSAIYAPFRHAAWHGFTITDLVFPTFLFVVGNAMSFSMRKFEKQETGVFLRKVFKRTALIFLIGLFLNGFPFIASKEAGAIELLDFSSLRIMGVLQRIALCYLATSLIIRFFKLRGAIIFGIVLLVVYWVIMYLFGDQPAPYSLEGNAALKFDRLVLPANNLYKGFGIPFDPEGLLSTLPAIVNVIAGYCAGLFIQRKGNNRGTVFYLTVAGLLFVGFALLWDILFPINKPIWTSSYVLHTVGLDLIIIAVLMLVIEVARIRNWTYFFEVFGRNPLFIYALSGLLIKAMSFVKIGGASLNAWIYDNLFLSWLAGKNASLLFAVVYMLVLWLVGYIMDKRKVYVKV